MRGEFARRAERPATAALDARSSRRDARLPMRHATFVTTYSSRRLCDDGAEDHTTNGFAGRGGSCACDGS